VGCEIAHTLGAPLDVLAARRIWAPGQPDLAIGAVAPGGVCILHDALIAKLGVSPLYIQIAMAEQVLEADQMMRRYRRGRKAPEIAGRAVIVVDDGIASGTTAAAALEAARRAGAAQLILAAPVAAGRALESIRLRANEVVSLLEVAEPDFGMVSQYYEDFSPPGEAAMLTLLERAAS
jgi:predicted phosphoribosyltransferase